MSKFMKLTNLVLNTNDIHKIIVYPDKYHIHIISKQIDGYGWGFSWDFGVGFSSISSYTSEIELCKTKHSIDYKIVSDWISKIE